MLKLDLMAVFAHVATSGSFTAAAQRLGVPKSTVSQRVVELEQAVGLRLLHRTTRKLSLTEAGRVYLGYCLAILEQAGAADAALSTLRDAPTGLIRLTAPEASGLKLMPPMLADFRRAYPQVEVQLTVTDQQLDLVAERIDVALRTGQLQDSSFISRRVGQVRRVLVASPAYLDKHGRPDTPSALALHACLMHQSAPQWRFEQAPSDFTPGLRTLGSNSLVYLLQMALLGTGIAMLPAFLCGDEIREGRLEIVLEHCALSPNDYYLVYPSRSHPSAAFLALLDFIAQWDIARRIA